MDLNGDVAGRPAPPIVLVHGAWVDDRTWRMVAASHRVVRYLSEQPGSRPTPKR